MMASSPNQPREGATEASNRPDRARSPISISPEEQRRRAESARQVVADMRAIENGPDEDDGEFLRALDEAHPGRFDLARYYADGSDPA